MAELKHFDDLYPGRFLKAGNLGDKPVTLRIAKVDQEVLEGEKGPEKKVTLSFANTERQLVLCKLNAHCLKAMFGAKVADWIGKRVTFFATDQIMPMPSRKGDDRYCIRVWGSPEIAQDFSFQWTPPRRKALTLTMHAVRRTETAPQATQPQQLADTTPATGNEAQASTCTVCGVVSAEGPVDASGRCVECATANQ